MNFNLYTPSRLNQKCGLIAAFLFFLTTQVFAQHHYYRKDDPEIGFFAGLSNYQGDLVNKLVTPEFFRPTVGVFGRVFASQHIAFRGGLSYGQIEADDAFSNIQSHKIRNLSFRTTIYDGYIAMEYIPFKVTITRYTNFFPYIYAGLGVFNFNPTAYYKGQWYNLHDYSTEGQGLNAYPNRQPYALTQMCIPMGVGFRYKFNDAWSIGFDLRDNKTYTDYLDDVSSTYVRRSDLINEKGAIAAALADRRGEIGFEPSAAGNIRGNDKVKDYYIYSGVTLSYTPHKRVKCFVF